MILNCGAVLVQWRPFSRMKTVCLASTSAKAEQLRQQLDDLHKEAENKEQKLYERQAEDPVGFISIAKRPELVIRCMVGNSLVPILLPYEGGLVSIEIISLFSLENILDVPRFISKDLEHKLLASNARLRLMRLSEAVEKLRRQAAVSVQTGKENDARELLFSKEEVEELLISDLYMEKAISVKESLLISNMALDLEVSEIKAPTPVRIVSLTEVSQNDTDDSQHLYMNNLEFPEDQELQVASDSLGDIHAENELKSHEESFSKQKSGADSVQSSREISTFEEFMDHLDQQLNKIEEELETFLRFSNLLLGSKEKPEYSKVQHAIEILEGVRHTRERFTFEPPLTVA
ncbi:hypothetical protein Sango_1296200 [Sesamum angolense]|uniref:Uncharacterized protein n=1 Tax=Sesamum angolense TaxID=2727404 RepID=A0AAE2BUF3_9LAMI|nr:hypothetical protein Sango_1296200 [Sesamum angolense]